MISPAFVHGWTPPVVGVDVPGPDGGIPPCAAGAPPPSEITLPVSEVTRAVMLPSPSSGWCTK
jgi:hypothetical protein